MKINLEQLIISFEIVGVVEQKITYKFYCKNL